jgi:hypothetical protein
MYAWAMVGGAVGWGTREGRGQGTIFGIIYHSGGFWVGPRSGMGERVVSNKETNSQQNTLQKKKNRELVISGM